MITITGAGAVFGNHKAVICPSAAILCVDTIVILGHRIFVEDKAKHEGKHKNENH
jgi:hypothetical protein